MATVNSCFGHVHVLVPDGVFTRSDDGAAVFRQGPAPTRANIAAVAARAEKRRPTREASKIRHST